MVQSVTFQARHYEATARAIAPRVAFARDMATNPDSTMKEDGNVRLFECFLVVRDFAAMFESDNPRFDRNRFLSACGLTETDALYSELKGDAAARPFQV